MFLFQVDIKYIICGKFTGISFSRLAHGCLSARQIFFEIKKYEKERTQNQSTYWVIFELMWRDYFKFVALKYGEKLFAKDGK